VAYLIDTNILARLANTADKFCAVATRAVLELHRHGEVLHVTSQNLVEFRNVATRPVAMSGLGLTPKDAEAKAAGFEAAFPLQLETPNIFPLWKTVVGTLAIVGKQVHDARLVAVCHAHKVPHLLTFNVVHFSRLATFGTGITVVDPASV
jgi:predicted nucleic acid-binding protein